MLNSEILLIAIIVLLIVGFGAYLIGIIQMKYQADLKIKVPEKINGIEASALSAVFLQVLAYLEKSRIFVEDPATTLRRARIYVYINDKLFYFIGEPILKHMDSRYFTDFDSPGGEEFLNRLYEIYSKYFNDLPSSEILTDKHAKTYAVSLIHRKGMYDAIGDLAVQIYHVLDEMHEDDFASIVEEIDDKDVQQYIIHLNADPTKDSTAEITPSNS